MTAGIYKLNFPNTAKVYIGKSLWIEKRFTNHLIKLRKGLSAKKLQEGFNTFGEPRLEILVSLDPSELFAAELEAIEIFDSINNGFNTLQNSNKEPGVSGEHSSNAKYCNDQYLEVLYFLAYTSMSYTDISLEVGVSHHVISSISKGENHRWLLEEDPATYKIVQDKFTSGEFREVNTAKARGILYPKVKSPAGEVVEIGNLREFSRQHGLDSGNLSNLLSGRYTTLKGWTLADNVIKEYSIVISPQGEEFTIPYRGARTFCREHSLSPGALSDLLSRKIPQHKGWTLKTIRQ